MGQILSKVLLSGINKVKLPAFMHRGMGEDKQIISGSSKCFKEYMGNRYSDNGRLSYKGNI